MSFSGPIEPLDGDLPWVAGPVAVRTAVARSKGSVDSLKNRGPL